MKNVQALLDLSLISHSEAGIHANGSGEERLTRRLGGTDADFHSNRNGYTLRPAGIQDIVVSLCGFLRVDAKLRWESGVNPELPRSGKQERTPTMALTEKRLGSWASRQPASPKTCHRDIRLRLRGGARWQRFPMRPTPGA